MEGNNNDNISNSSSGNDNRQSKKGLKIWRKSRFLFIGSLQRVGGSKAKQEDFFLSTWELSEWSEELLTA